MLTFFKRLPLRNRARVTAKLASQWRGLPALHSGTSVSYSTAGAGVRDKHVLILGCGFMSGPLIEYLCQRTDCKLTIGTRMQGGSLAVSEKLSSLDLKGRDISVKQVDVTDSEALGQLMKDKDLCISFATSHMHFHALRQCLEHGVDLVTPSYPCPEFMELGKEAAARGITVICEQGCDPGIDHMMAMQYIDKVHAQGGKIDSYVMYCDGVPAPEDADNALKFKVCWDPQRTLLNTFNPAKYYENGKLVDVPAGGEVLKMAKTVRLGEHEFEGTPNRDCLRYVSIYGIEGVQTLLRGLYKYKGYAEKAIGLQRIGIISENKQPNLKGDMTWNEIMCSLLNVSPSGLEEAVLQRVDGNRSVLQAVHDLGLLSDTSVRCSETLLDTFANYLKTKLAYKPGEREWVILWQQIEASYGSRKERCTNVLESYGYPIGGHSASAYTTALPPAVTARMMIEGKLKKPGMHYPVTRDIYEPVLAELKEISTSWGKWSSVIEQIE